MSKSKKFISIVLALIMVVSLASISNAAADALSNGDYEYTLLTDGTAEITKYKGDDMDIIVPEKIDGYIVTSIGKDAFSFKWNYKFITLPNNIKRIEESAFAWSALVSIYLPEGLEEIGAHAFENTRIFYITIPGTVKTIGNCAFLACNNLKHITVSDSVIELGKKSIGYKSDFGNRGDYKDEDFVIYGNPGTRAEEYANNNGISFNSTDKEPSFERPSPFEYNVLENGTAKVTAYYYGGSTNLIIPDEIDGYKITIIGEIDSGFTSVTIPAGVDTLEIGKTEVVEYKIDSANKNLCSINGDIYSKDRTTIIKYAGGKKDKEIIIPEYVTEIGSHAFQHAERITKVTIPETVKTIGERAFEGCNSLTGIVIPKSVTTLGYYAFGYCKNLTDVTLPYSVSKVKKGIFEGCENLKNIIIPNGFQYISEEMFNGCTSLEKINIPDSVNQIGNGAFSFCTSLREITIPEKVSYIPEDAFVGCNNLKKAIILNPEIEIEEGAFRYYYNEVEGNQNYELTIFGYAGSSAQEFANSNGFPFVIYEGKPAETSAPQSATKAPQPATSAPVETQPVKLTPGFYVTGSKGLCGTEWANTADPNTLMTLKSDGSYEKVFTNVPAGSYFFKVIEVTDAGKIVWHPGGTDNDSEVTVANAGATVTVSLVPTGVSDRDTATAEVSGGQAPVADPTEAPAATPTEKPAEDNTPAAEPTEKPTEGIIPIVAPTEKPTEANSPTEAPKPDDTKSSTLTPGVYVTGSEGLCGTEWANTADPNTLMTLKSDGSYEKVFTNVPAGEYSFKVIKVTDSGEIVWYPGGVGNDSKVKVDNNASTVTVSVVLTDLPDQAVPAATVNAPGDYIVPVIVPEEKPTEEVYPYDDYVDVVEKEKNPLWAKGKTKKVKYSKVKKAKQTVKAIEIDYAKGKVSYSKVSGSSKLTVNKTTGKITVKKKTKKGTYKIKVKITAKGTSYYKKGSKTVTVTIKVV